MVIEHLPYANHIPSAEDTEQYKRDTNPALREHVFQLEDTGNEYH